MDQCLADSSGSPEVPGVGALVAFEKIYITRYLDTVGDGSGDKNMAQDFSLSEGKFIIAPSSTNLYFIARILVWIKDTGNFDADKYGNAIDVTNGIEMHKTNPAGNLIDLTDGFPIKTNADWMAVAFDFAYNSIGVGDNIASVRWTFAKAGVHLLLHGDASEQLEVTLNDNFAGLTGHRMKVQGYSWKLS